MSGRRYQQRSDLSAFPAAVRVDFRHVTESHKQVAPPARKARAFSKSRAVRLDQTSSEDGGAERRVVRSPRAPARYEDKYLQDSLSEVRLGSPVNKAPRKSRAPLLPQRTQSKRFPPESKAFARQTWTPQPTRQQSEVRSPISSHCSPQAQSRLSENGYLSPIGACMFCSSGKAM